MNIFNQELHFDKNKPFYPLVIAYLAQVHGFIELCSRGCKYRLAPVYDKMKNNNELLDNFDKFMLEGIKPKDFARVKKIIQGGITSLIGKQQLGSITGQNININIDELAIEIFNNGVAVLEYFLKMATGSLLILSWELTAKDHTEHEIWEFLRHCRNAAAHGGLFHFFRGEPKNPSK